jgi:hypothetical protein
MLQNNSSQMKTVVETFIIEETISLIYDNDQLDAWNKKVEELGLTGQTKLVKPDKSPVPFMFMNQTTKAVFETLCPRKVSIESYNITPIPVEILDLVALSKKEDYFDKLEIWYDDKNPDPACVGINKKWGEMNNYNFATQKEAESAIGKSLSSWNYEEKYYLLGKWADVKQSFEQLKARAIERFKEQEINTAKTQIKYYERKIEDIDIEATNKFGASLTDNALLPF